jgi:hypothetical protein
MRDLLGRLVRPLLKAAVIADHRLAVQLVLRPPPKDTAVHLDGALLVTSRGDRYASETSPPTTPGGCG